MKEKRGGGCGPEQKERTHDDFHFCPEGRARGVVLATVLYIQCTRYRLSE